MKGAGKGFPWATLAVNLAGCFLIGLLWGLFSKNGTEGSNWALFLTVGLCGHGKYKLLHPAVKLATVKELIDWLSNN